jgi:predicted nucleic acid-binding Zn ribbon protein
MNRRAPRPIAAALATLARTLEPSTPLARVQGVWESVVGPAVAAHCMPVGERGGVLQVACDEAVWAAELELMGPELVARVAAAVGRPEITSLRARATLSQAPK